MIELKFLFDTLEEYLNFTKNSNFFLEKSSNVELTNEKKTQTSLKKIKKEVEGSSEPKTEIVKTVDNALVKAEDPLSIVENSKITLDDIRKSMADAFTRSESNRNKVIAELTKLGYAKVMDIPDSEYQYFNSFLKKL